MARAPASRSASDVQTQAVPTRDVPTIDMLGVTHLVMGVGIAVMPLRCPPIRHSLGDRGEEMIHADASTGSLLVYWRDGEASARDRLINRLYPDLAQIAAARLRGERDSSLSTGDLINDAVIRLLRIEKIDIADRAHFIALASRLMRNILVDHVRSKNADRRRHVKVELCTRLEGEQAVDLRALDCALIRLAAIDPQLIELVEMRYFGGMTIADMSLVTGLSQPTVKRRWQTARAWLVDALANPIDD